MVFVPESQIGSEYSNFKVSLRGQKGCPPRGMISTKLFIFKTCTQVGRHIYTFPFKDISHFSCAKKKKKKSGVEGEKLPLRLFKEATGRLFLQVIMWSEGAS